MSIEKQQERRNIWAESFQVRFANIDRSDRLTLASIFNFFQEIAISHAENLGVGRDSMSAGGQVWILSRMSVQVDRRPKYGEIVTARTWPRGGEKLFAFRDYDIRDSDDMPVIRARSCWLIVDIEKRRPLRPKDWLDRLPLNEGTDALPGSATGLTQRENLQKTAERTAAYSDLDYNGHVNNVSYIHWIQDALDPKLLEEASQMRFDINYLNEILPGEVTGIWTAPIAGNAFAVEGRRSAGQAVFRAELRVNSASPEYRVK